MLNRRSFLMLPALAPLAKFDRSAESDQHHFHYDFIVGTSMDLVVWTGKIRDSQIVAQRIAASVLGEIERLTSILSTRRSTSEISHVERNPERQPSPDLSAVLNLYNVWNRRTDGVISLQPNGPNTGWNVDALGKAYIIDRAVSVTAQQNPGISLLLNIGGDIAVRGLPREVGIANPAWPHDNADPLSWITLRNQAVATSGTYARGAHLIDARTGISNPDAASATAIAPDAVTANALATTLSVAAPDEGMDLIERTAGAEAFRIDRDGTEYRSSGFSRIERFRKIVQTSPTNWPANYEVSIAVTLTNPIPGGDFPYLGAWVENTSGKLVRAIVLWGSKDKYKPELSSFWIATGGKESLIYKVTRVTKGPGSYKIAWNGLDDDGIPVPRGNYKITIETNQYHGTYAKQSGVITCTDVPASITLSGTTNFEPISIKYEPKPTAV